MIGLAFGVDHLLAQDCGLEVGTLFTEFALFDFGLEGEGSLPHDG